MNLIDYMEFGGPGSGRHKFKTGDEAHLGLEPNSEYEVTGGHPRISVDHQSFSDTTVKNTKFGKTHSIPTGNAQMMGYLPYR